MRSDGFDHIGHRQHLRLGQDGVTLETLRITAAVKPFMVLANDVCHRKRKCHVFQNFIANLGMFAHQPHLQVGQASGFGQNFGRYPDLADVMHQAHHFQYVATLLRPAHLAGDGAGNQTDAALMAGGVGIALVDHVRDRLQRAAHRGLELLHVAGNFRLRLLTLGDVLGHHDGGRCIVPADAAGMQRQLTDFTALAQQRHVVVHAVFPRRQPVPGVVDTTDILGVGGGEVQDLLAQQLLTRPATHLAITRVDIDKTAVAPDIDAQHGLLDHGTEVLLALAQRLLAAADLGQVGPGENGIIASQTHGALGNTFAAVFAAQPEFRGMHHVARSTRVIDRLLP